jgi:molecular chaperone GrpE
MSDEVQNDGQQPSEPPVPAQPDQDAAAQEAHRQRLAELETQSAQLKDQLLRKAAEFDN